MPANVKVCICSQPGSQQHCLSVKAFCVQYSLEELFLSLLLSVNILEVEYILTVNSSMPGLLFCVEPSCKHNLDHLSVNSLYFIRFSLVLFFYF